MSCNKEDSSLILGKFSHGGHVEILEKLSSSPKVFATGLDKHGPEIAYVIPAFPR